MSNRVYMVWDYYDGVRSGIADYDGQPHYFECQFDTDADEFSDRYDLYRISDETLELALEQWAIYRDWELRFHSGSEPHETHPGHGGIDGRYDELERLVRSTIKKNSISATVDGVFRPIEDQPELPVGCLRELEVDWLRKSDSPR